MIDQEALAEELEALQYSLKTEEDGYSYYRDASERTDHPVVKKFFATLAEDEKKHINLINQFHRSMKETPDGVDLELPESPGDHRKKLKTIFEEAQKEIKQNVPPDTGILDVYRHAMDLETKAANYYKERRDITPFERSKKFFDWLFHFESYHYQMLSETLAYLQNPEQWFQAYEKSIFEG